MLLNCNFNYNTGLRGFLTAPPRSLWLCFIVHIYSHGFCLTLSWVGWWSVFFFFLICIPVWFLFCHKWWLNNTFSSTEITRTCVGKTWNWTEQGSAPSSSFTCTTADAARKQPSWRQRVLPATEILHPNTGPTAYNAPRWKTNVIISLLCLAFYSPTLSGCDRNVI